MSAITYKIIEGNLYAFASDGWDLHGMARVDDLEAMAVEAAQ
jgi:hypothetical protein